MCSILTDNVGVVQSKLYKFEVKIIIQKEKNNDQIDY